jgi:coenzyme F420-reducing hydrogenase alpha subunit
MSETKRTRTIEVDYLARVEGEGALFVDIEGDALREVAFKIFEPPRFFEAFLRGRDFSEAPDITARICGICPVAYQMSAVHAMERACDVEVGGQLRALRRLLYCGEWIESHVLHVYMLHAPDFLGYESGVAMARDHREAVERGLELKKIGNEIVSTLAGREIHPINVRVGGFHRVPRRGELDGLGERLLRAADLAEQTVELVSSFDFPDFEQDYELVSLVHPDEYPMNEGRIVSSRGLDIEASDWDAHFREEHVERSNALHCRLVDRGHYLVGPMARYSQNFERLAPRAQAAARAAGLGETCTNPFRSIVVRAVEVLHACEEARRLVEAYEPPDEPCVEVRPRAATGHAATEAPRGLLYHRYDITEDGRISLARIVPPTSQNQGRIEDDLRAFIAPRLDLDDERLQWQCEQAIRNYDPCISCSAHFLKLHVDRR